MNQFNLPLVKGVIFGVTLAKICALKYKGHCKSCTSSMDHPANVPTTLSENYAKWLCTPVNFGWRHDNKWIQFIHDTIEARVAIQRTENLSNTSVALGRVVMYPSSTVRFWSIRIPISSWSFMPPSQEVISDKALTQWSHKFLTWGQTKTNDTRCRNSTEWCPMYSNKRFQHREPNRGGNGVVVCIILMSQIHLE